MHILGIGAISPFGRGAAPLLEALCGLKSAVARYQPFVSAGLRYPMAAAVPQQALDLASDDPARDAAMLEMAVRDALLDASGAASLQAFDVPPDRVALVVGTSSAGIASFSRAIGHGCREAQSALYSSATLRVVERLGIRGPVLTICSVCASGALAVAEAAELVLSGQADVAIAAGVDPLVPFVGAGFGAIGALAEVPQPFRLGRRGLVLGEGAAAIVLRKAPARASRGRLLGWGSSCDAHHLTAPHPEGLGVRLAIGRALALAKLEPEAIDVVNAHGTGTPFNDAMEASALRAVLGARVASCPVYTIKGATGHTLGAAGALEAVVALAAMQKRVIPPTFTSGEPDPACDLDLVVEAPRMVSTRCTLSISAGFGGANCALLLAPPEENAA